jgi:hypothetical protein
MQQKHIDILKQFLNLKGKSPTLLPPSPLPPAKSDLRSAGELDNALLDRLERALSNRHAAMDPINDLKALARFVKCFQIPQRVRAPLLLPLCLLSPSFPLLLLSTASSMTTVPTSPITTPNATHCH